MNNNPLLKYSLFALAFTLCFDASAQLAVASNSNPADLANKLVGAGVTITNATLKCPAGAAGTFSTGPSINEVGINSGILLTSGQISLAAHSNDIPGAGMNNGAPGNPDLDKLLPAPPPSTFDGCMLEFDLESIGNQVSFEYVFASEEYEEYYCSIFNDVFGFLVSGPNPGGGAAYADLNIALIPSTSKAVSINSVGPPQCGTFAAPPNSPGSPGTGDPAFYQNMTGATSLQYDGKTVLLTAKIALKACQKYHFKLGVQDASDGILDSGVFIKEGSFKSTPPEITCPASKTVNNDPGLCAAKVTFSAPTTISDCPVTTACVPPSGSTFPVGTSTVTCTATDQLGNKGDCNFTITVKDAEKPSINCPANITISCETSSLPGAVGSPAIADNCGVLAATFLDANVPGSCPNEFTINRTWTVKDAAGNANTCLHVIKVEDKKSPIITCPANITVTCDTSAAKTGFASATDNCDPSVSITRRDIHIMGDCEWFCITERHWTATDDCRNTSKCVQTITKDVTPLIEQALASGPLKWGQNAATVTLPPGRGACVVQWLPYSGTVPKALKFDDAVAGVGCTLMTNPLDPSGHIVNPLLGEAMKLKILVRLKPSLGTTKLSAIPCEMHFIVKQALAPNPDVNELLRVTDLTLGNVNVNLLVPEHAMHLLKVLKCVNAGRNVCNP
ncbi:MAG: choice-of-anchor L domain-containing protein [Saprospiraceae bacterium]|nr:choice-of-anchor L domain-containing protein [Saprospiraceae bacterium]